MRARARECVCIYVCDNTGLLSARFRICESTGGKLVKTHECLKLDMRPPPPPRSLYNIEYALMARRMLRSIYRCALLFPIIKCN